MTRRNPPAPAIALAVALVFVFVSAAGPAPADEPKADALTPATLAERLKAKPTGDDAAKLAEEIRRWFGGKANLEKGPGPKVEERAVAWAIEAPGAAKPPQVVSDDGAISLGLVRVGDSDVYATAAVFPDGFATRWSFEVDGKTLPHSGADADARQRAGGSPLEVYSEPADNRERSDVPKGKLTPMPKLRSKVFEGTSRDWWVYVPAQSSGDTPACVMVFQDGAGYKGFIPTTFDNLIARKEMPVTVAVFINPGAFDDGRPNPSNRSFEYDTLSDQYVRFLLDEALPEAERSLNLKLRHDAAGRAIAGISSGGICAWTAAWERPDQFSKVLSWVGSFTNIASGKTGREGGHNYEAMIRKTDKKPIRAFLQDGANDLDNASGNWPLANQQMAKSLAFAGYDHQFVFGNGFHSNKHGRSILPDSLRWLWRGWESETPGR